MIAIMASSMIDYWTKLYSIFLTCPCAAVLLHPWGTGWRWVFRACCNEYL